MRKFKTGRLRNGKHRRKFKIHMISTEIHRNVSIFLIYIQNRDKEQEKFIKEYFFLI